MAPAYSDDIRWLVIYKRLVLGHSAAQVSHALEGLREARGGEWRTSGTVQMSSYGVERSASCPQSSVCADTQQRWINQFLVIGEVHSSQGRRTAPPANREMGEEEVHWLFTKLLHTPCQTHRERARHFEDEFGRRVDKSTICRAVRYLLLHRRQKDRAPAHAVVPTEH